MHASYVLRIRTISHADDLHVGFLKAFLRTALRDRFEGALFASVFPWIYPFPWSLQQAVCGEAALAMVQTNNRLNDGNNAAKL